MIFVKYVIYIFINWGNTAKIIFYNDNQMQSWVNMNSV